MERPIVAITMGDPAGIGPEISIKAIINSEVLRNARCLLIGDINILKLARKYSKIAAVEFRPIKEIAQAKFIRGKIDVLDLQNVPISKYKIGVKSALSGRAAIEYIEAAINIAINGKVDAITTGPINKESIHKAGFKYAGHTEILAKRTKCKKYAMMFVSESIWIILVSTHLALARVPTYITKEKVLNTIKLAQSTLLKVRGRAPRIAVAGLNPHAGEGGIFGKEDLRIIKPAVDAARKAGINVEGPISPDAVYYLAKVGMYDIVVSMYHDQGLIPLKLLSFNNSVNVTVGLPIVRTSVDHGTGFDIAGRGWANPSSLIQAIKVAAHFAKS
ncbi:4-hydroxythreonine-4-phosphate dehydrogenase PdxA [Candidatus Margulisiibacteriota bacterium]